MKNILIVGKASSAVDEIARRMIKENNRVYLLSACSVEHAIPNVKSYCYAYDSSSVYEVFGSCRPDVVVFMGAYDTFYTWGTPNDDRNYQGYVVGLTNILRISEKLGVQRFLYLSSGVVFEEEYTCQISEQVEPSPRSAKAKAVAIGEMMVGYYHRNLSLDGIIVRFDHLFFCPRDAGECVSLYTEACRTAAVDGIIKIHSKVSRSGIWIKDAAQALYLLVTAPSHRRSLYHVAGNALMSGSEMARFIQSCCAREVVIQDSSADTQRVIQLQDSYFAAEFQFDIHYSMETGISIILQSIQKNINRFQKSHSSSGLKKAIRRLCKKIIPYLEALLVFFPVFFLQQIYGQSELFTNLDLFLLYSLAFSMMNGLPLAVFTGVLSTIGYLLLRTNTTSTLQMLIDVSTYIWIACHFVVGLSVGHLSDSLRNLRADKDEEIHYLNGRLADLSEINESTASIKNYFETEVINSQESLSAFYDIMTSLDNAEDSGILFEVVKVLKQTMNTDSVAIYCSSGPDFYRLLSNSDTTSNELGRSLRVSDFEDIFDCLQRDQIYINTSSDPQLPSMVGCTRDENDKVQMALFLWRIPFDQMTLQSRNRFRILCLLIRGTLLRASRYQDALIQQRYLPGTHLLNKAAFLEVERVYHKAAENQLVKYVTIRILYPWKNTLQVRQMLGALFREVDVLGEFAPGVYYAIALNSSLEDAPVILSRLRKNGFAGTIVPCVLPEDQDAANAGGAR